MSEGNTTRISAQEALRRIERGESLTDWARVRALSDAEIEPAAAQDPDWQDVDPDWVAKAEPIRPVRKRRLTLALDEDVIDWFRSQDRHYRHGSTRFCAPAWRATAREAALVCWSETDEGYIAVLPDLPGLLDFRQHAGGSGARDRRRGRGLDRGAPRRRRPGARAGRQGASGGVRTLQTAERPPETRIGLACCRCPLLAEPRRVRG